MSRFNPGERHCEIYGYGHYARSLVAALSSVPYLGLVLKINIFLNRYNKLKILTIYKNSIIYNYTMKPKQTISLFDLYLFKQGKKFEAIIIGGGALSLMDIITRETQDIDILDPILPDEILKLSQEFSKEINKNNNLILKKNWFNNGPESLKKNLPHGWQNRTECIYTGRALTFHALGRSDFIKTKLFAFCDREQDRADCLLLKPSEEELLQAMTWVKQQDQNPNWPAHVEASFKSLAKDLGYAI